MGAKGGDNAEKCKRGRKPDRRPQVAFRVEQPVYDTLASMQSQTGQTPDQIAGLLLHVLVNDPATAVPRLSALLAPTAPTEQPQQQRPTLLQRKDLAG